MSKGAKCLVLGASLVVFGNGVYFNSKPALVIGCVYALLALLDVEISGMD